MSLYKCNLYLKSYSSDEDLGDLRYCPLELDGHFDAK